MSARPKLVDWASNANHPAGAAAWNGQPTKVEPAAGRIAGGWEPETAGAPEHFNWLLNNVYDSLDWLAALQAGSWSDVEANAVTAASWAGVPTPRSMCYDSANLAFHGINSNGFVILSCDRGVPGVAEPVGALGASWRDEAGALPSAVWAGGGVYVDIEADDAGARVACSDAAAAQVMQAAAPDGGWAATVPATGGVFWSHVEYDPTAGLWIIGGSLGEVETSPDRVVWTARAPALGGTQITALKANRDAAAPWVIAADATRISRSNDGGLTWASFLHLLGSAPTALAYDATRARWYMMMGIPTGVLYSDDQGLTWAACGAPPGIATPTGPTTVDIDTDQMGNVLIVVDTGPGGAAGTRQMFHSRDGGATWALVPHSGTRVFHGAFGTAVAPWSAGVRYGGGRWACIGEDSTPAVVGLVSMLIHP